MISQSWISPIFPILFIVCILYYFIHCVYLRMYNHSFSLHYTPKGANSLFKGSKFFHLEADLPIKRDLEMKMAELLPYESNNSPDTNILLLFPLNLFCIKYHVCSKDLGNLCPDVWSAQDMLDQFLLLHLDV